MKRQESRSIVASLRPKFHGWSITKHLADQKTTSEQIF